MKSIRILIILAVLLPVAALAASNSQIAQIEQVTAQIRQLKPLHPVKVVFDSDVAFNALISDRLKRDNPLTEIAIGQRESVVLGLLKSSESLQHILYSSLSTNVVGMYDDITGTLYIRNHAHAALGVDRHTIAHEYDHALQDQYYDLKTFVPDQTSLAYRDSDMVSAHHALSEGDAVNTELQYVYKTYSAQDLQALARQSSKPDGSEKLPKSIQREFYFPYTTGKAFVDVLFRKGGEPAIDAAFKRPPQSTYEIMHPSAYFHRWTPAVVTMHAITGLNGWTQVDDDVFGAFGYNLLLRQFGSSTVADHITDSYRGDRYVFLENGAQDLMLFRSIWTSNAAAKAARAAYITALSARFHTTQSISSGGVTVIKEKAGVVAFRVSGANLVMVYAPLGIIARQAIAAPVT